jgi:hypothetical protein
MPCTGSGRKSELNINTINILLRVIKDSFSTLQFTTVLEFVSHCFTFCVQCLSGGHHPRVLCRRVEGVYNYRRVFIHLSFP